MENLCHLLIFIIHDALATSCEPYKLFASHSIPVSGVFLLLKDVANIPLWDFDILCNFGDYPE